MTPPRSNFTPEGEAILKVIRESNNKQEIRDKEHSADLKIIERRTTETSHKVDLINKELENTKKLQDKDNTMFQQKLIAVDNKIDKHVDSHKKTFWAFAQPIISFMFGGGLILWFLKGK